jgi:hypothetical protein
MSPIFRKTAGKDCWLDVYDSSYFDGKLRRYFGPVEISRLAGGSIIVGPQASIRLTARRHGKPIFIELKPNRVIPDLSTTLRGATIDSAKVSRPAHPPQ